MKHKQRYGDIRDPWGKELGKLPVLLLRLNGSPPRMLEQA